MFYSPKTEGFYSCRLFGQAIPEDAIEVNVEEYSKLLAGKYSGREIVKSEQGTLTLSDLPLVDFKAQVSNRRYQVETVGIVVDGKFVLTDRNSQALITGAALAALLDPNYSCQWKMPSGFVNLDAKQIIGLAKAVRTHIQACFDREAELLAHLEAGTFEESMLDQGWPA